MDIEKEIKNLEEMKKNIKDMETGPEYESNDRIINGYNLNIIKETIIKQLEIKRHEYINLKK